MIRFIDLRNQDTGYAFAFWDTVTDRFITIGSDQAWDNIEDLIGSADGSDTVHNQIERMIDLCPSWVR